jgi:hypothetical protein
VKIKSLQIAQLFLLFLVCLACSGMMPTGTEETPTADDESEVGSVSISALTATTATASYCVEGKIQIRKGSSEVGGGAVVQTINTTCTDKTLSTVLRTGSYYVTMASGFKCSTKASANANSVAVPDCTLTQPTTFQIVVGKTTPVPLKFVFNTTTEDPALVVFSVGGATVTLDPSLNQHRLCGPGFATGPECNANSVCASINFGDPACYQVCQRDIDCPSDLLCIPVVQKDQIWSSTPVNQLLRLCQSVNNDGAGGAPPDDRVCPPGFSQGCTCTDGRSGAQICNSNGTGYNVCQCTGPSGGGGTSSGSGGTPGSGGTGTTNGGQDSWNFEYTLPYDVPSVTNVILSVIWYNTTYNTYSGKMYMACSAHSPTPSEVFVKNGLTYTCTSMIGAGYVPETDVLIEAAGASQFPNGGQYVDACWGQGSNCYDQSCFRHFGTLKLYRNGSLVSVHDVSNSQSGCNIRPL